ncbi:hypothetical protein SSX86_023556 [Deinandra increscens subsp. villosa]|uniref:Ubiquitin-like domain-containing protein n=1 Tax=Deinandra increscens subsp. villosa TaxID=3103831 RepID=A0AAP0CL06_9ASTR
MVQTRAEKADKGKGIGKGKRKRKHTTTHVDSTKDMSYGYFNDDKINIKLPCGKIKSFGVQDSDTFGSIKLKIEAEEHIPFDKQELVYNQNVPLDKDTVSNLYMKKGDFLTLMTKSNGRIKIYVVDLYDTYSIYVKPDVTTIGDVISMTLHYDPDEVALALTFNEIVLEDSDTLASSNITDGSTLKVLVNSLGCVNIKVNMYTGKTITLPVRTTDTIEEVKVAIQDEEDIHPDEQVLIFNNMVLGDGGTLYDFGIRRDSTLVLMHRPFEFTASRRIFIKTLTGETVTQEVDPFDTIADVKAKIEGKVNVPFDEQEFIFNAIVLSDIHTVAGLRINDGCTLTLMHKPRVLFSKFMRISIKTLDGETITQEVTPSDTIRDLKAKIKDKVDVPCDEQELIFNEMVMSNVDTLADFNINKGSTLTLMRISSGLMRIFVNLLLEGKTITFTLDVRPSNTIADVKSKLFDMGKISRNMKDMGVLIFNRKHLEDGAILADYNIPKESTVRLSVGRDFRIPKEVKAEYSD